MGTGRFRRLLITAGTTLSILLSVLIPVGSAGSASAAPVSYTFKDANTITATGGDFPDTITLTKDGNNYKGSFSEIISHGSQTRTWTISGLSARNNTTNSYTATINNEGQGAGGNIKGPITITDPNSVGPGAPAKTGGTGGSATVLDDEEKPVCEASPNPLTWILCPISNGLGNASDWVIQNIIAPFLRPSPIGLNPDDKATGSVYQIWSTMRVYADIILVILLMVAIVSQAYGGGIVEAYTAKKMLPRIFVAAILINISIYIVAFAIDLALIIGTGIADIITTPLVQTGNFKFNLTNTQVFAISTVTAFMIAATKVMVGIPEVAAFLPYLLIIAVIPVALAMAAVFLMLVILQGLFMALTIFSPLAFALYAFPNTEKYFHTWWEWLFRSLLVYPIFMAIVGISDVMTVLIQKANGG